MEPASERAILVGAARRGLAGEAEEHLNELARLTDTAGARVVGRLTQRIEAPTPNYYLGLGKVRELGAFIGTAGATLVVFDEELSPAQGKNLESALQVRIMDRAEVILDIFARRAKSKEAKMQVELAQLEYLLPRLARMWVHLSRIRGGIGLRGPGETQLETDRRMIRRKITTLRRKLKDVARHRRVLRSGRRAIPTAVLVGYTNTGKSSLLKALSGADAFIEDRLFATLDTLTREVVLDGGRDRAERAEPAASPREFLLPGSARPAVVRLIDTVGFIRKLPHHLVASFRATLEEAGQADVLLHVVDASHPDWEEQVAVVDDVLGDLRPEAASVVHVFNKMDCVPDPAIFRAQVQHRLEPCVFVSARNRAVDDLTNLLARLAAAPRVAASTPAATARPDTWQ